MEIKVKLFGLARLGRPSPDADQGVMIELPDQARVCDLLNDLSIPKTRAIVMIRGRVARWDTDLHPGDEVEIVVPPGGG